MIHTNFLTEWYETKNDIRVFGTRVKDFIIDNRSYSLTKSKSIVNDVLKSTLSVSLSSEEIEVFSLNLYSIRIGSFKRFGVSKCCRYKDKVINEKKFDSRII